MALGRVKGQVRFEDPRELLGDRLRGIHRFLAEHGERIFGVDYFADVYKSRLIRRLLRLTHRRKPKDPATTVAA
jgi:hypothetical protein